MDVLLFEQSIFDDAFEQMCGSPGSPCNSDFGSLAVPLPCMPKQTPFHGCNNTVSPTCTLLAHDAQSEDSTDEGHTHSPRQDSGSLDSGAANTAALPASLDEPTADVALELEKLWQEINFDELMSDETTPWSADTLPAQDQWMCNPLFMSAPFPAQQPAAQQHALQQPMTIQDTTSAANSESLHTAASSPASTSPVDSASAQTPAQTTDQALAPALDVLPFFGQQQVFDQATWNLLGLDNLAFNLAFPGSAPQPLQSRDSQEPNNNTGPLSTSPTAATSSPFSMDSMCQSTFMNAGLLAGNMPNFAFDAANALSLLSPDLAGLCNSSPTNSNNNCCDKSGRWGNIDRRRSTCTTSGSAADMDRKYGKAVWCASGPCANNYWQPCEEHRCSCCKTGRKVAAFEKQGHCGPCGKREVVTGLRFIRCGKCKAEMVEKAYEAHLKQYVVVMDHEQGRKVPIRCKDFVHTQPKVELPCTEGKRCSKCSNMRPLSYFVNEESTCNWHNMQKPIRAESAVVDTISGLEAALNTLKSLPPSEPLPEIVTLKRVNKKADAEANEPKKRRAVSARGSSSSPKAPVAAAFTASLVSELQDMLCK